MNKIIIHHRSNHHASYSGYGRLIDYLDAHIIYGKTSFPYRLAKWIASRSNPDAGIYDSGSVFKEIELFRYLWKHRKAENVVHYLNGERDVGHLKLFKKLFPKTRFVATFHKPPAVLKQTIKDPSRLKQLDGAICVGSNQVEFIKKWLGLKHVQYIPHGVDTDFFTPDYQKRKKNMILFVGQHLRDFDLFNQVVSRLLKERENLEIIAVLHRAYKNKIMSHPQVTVNSGINDEELRNLYQQASLLFLPLLDSTACNSLLEAMACGLPIVTSDVGGNREYLEGIKEVMVAENNAVSYRNNVISLLENCEDSLRLSKSVRLRSEALDWTVISKDVTSFYKI